MALWRTRKASSKLQRLGLALHTLAAVRLLQQHRAGRHPPVPPSPSAQQVDESEFAEFASNFLLENAPCLVLNTVHS